MNNDIAKEKTCCFTGYRPQKICWNFDETSPEFLKVAKTVKKLINDAYDNGYKYFISGMALGFDTLCAEKVLELKITHPEIMLICAIPCKGQEKYWSESQCATYKHILNKADVVKYISEKYTRFCMQKRNRYMLNMSSMVIALFDGKPGGTEQTLNMAKRMNIKIVMISP